MWDILPTEIFFLFQEFLDDTEYISFMNSSKSIFSEIKRETIQYSFRSYWNNSLSFEEPNIKESLIQNVKDCNKQIYVTKYLGFDKETDLSQMLRKSTSQETIGSDREQRIREQTLIISFPFGELQRFPIKNLRIFSVSIRKSSKSVFDLSPLADSRVQIVGISGFCGDEIELKNLHCLRHSRFVRLIYCSNSDFNALAGGTVQELYFENCPELRDVSQFGRTPKLNLKSCDRISNLNGLNENKMLTLEGCSAISNYKLLVCKDLKLHSQRNVDSTVFQNRIRLCLNFYDAMDIIHPSLATLSSGPPLPQLTTLTLEYFPYNLDFSIFPNLEILKLVRCDGLTSFRGLGRSIHCITVESCKEVSDFSPLNFIPKVFLDHVNFQNGNELCPGKVQHLTLYGTNLITDLSMFSSLQFLKLWFLDHITSLDGVHDIVSITIRYCRGLTDASSLLHKSKQDKNDKAVGHQRIEISEHHYFTNLSLLDEYYFMYEVRCCTFPGHNSLPF